MSRTRIVASALVMWIALQLFSSSWIVAVPASHPMAWVTIICELVGVLAVLVGARMPLVSHYRRSFSLRRLPCIFRTASAPSSFVR